MPGRTCCVLGCSSNSCKIQAWNRKACEIHKPFNHIDCPCLRPYGLHRFPGRAEDQYVRRKWVTNINRDGFEPNKNTVVCGKHFPDGQPTKENPYPVLSMGYDLHEPAMSSYCCVPGCKSYKRKESCKRISFHRFPGNPTIRREWVVKIRRDKGPRFRVAKNTRVCSDHFPEESFTETLCGIRKLKAGVVPTLFTWTSTKPGRRTIIRTASHAATATCGEDSLGEESDESSHAATATCGDDALGEESDESSHSMGQDLQEDVACTSSEVEMSLPHPDHDYTQRPLSLEEQLQEARETIARQAEEISTLRSNQFLLKGFQCDYKQILFCTGFRDCSTHKAAFMALQPTAEHMPVDREQAWPESVKLSKDWLEEDLKMSQSQPGQKILSETSCGTLGAVASTANRGEGPLCKEEEEELHIQPFPIGDPEEGQKAELKQEPKWEGQKAELKQEPEWEGLHFTHALPFLGSLKLGLELPSGLASDEHRQRGGSALLEQNFDASAEAESILGTVASTANRGEGPLCKEEEEELHIQPCPTGDPEEGQQAELKQEPEWEGQHFTHTFPILESTLGADANSGEGPLCKEEEELHTQPCPAGDPEKGQQAELKQEQECEDPAEGLKIQCAWSMATRSEKVRERLRHHRGSSEDGEVRKPLISQGERTGRRKASLDTSAEAKSFAQPFGSKSHQRLHTGKKPHSCDKCGKSFTLLCNLKIHRRLHTGEKSYRCDECGKSFAQLSHLKSHQKVHTGEKPYSCVECGKAFTHLGNLKSHQRLHTGEKPHSCDECGKSFARLSTLKSHQRLHTGKKPLSCFECGKSFTDPGNLKTHQRLHTGEKPYSCDKCDKSFTHLGNLKSHQRLHTGKKPHNCDECGKSFTHLGNFKSHQRVHTGEKPHSCDECGKSFSRVFSLKSHQRVHTAHL